MADAFGTILDMSLTASLVVLVVLAGRFVLRKCPKVFSYALWSVVLFRLLCPVSFSAPVSVVQVSQPQVIVRSEMTSSVSYLPPVQQAAVPAAVPAEESISLEETVAWVWCGGVLAMACYGLWSLHKLRRQLLGAVKEGKGIYIADHIPTAFVIGLLRPRIYLPSGLSEQEKSYILAHERCHIRRGDHVLKVLIFAVLCLHWFNPLVWLAFFLAGKDMEMSCDEAVIRTLGENHRGDYAQVLLRQTAAGRKTIAVLSFGEGDLKGRIRNMARWKKPKLWIIVTALVLCGIVIAVCALNPGSGGFGTWMGEGEYENLTDESYTAYMQEAYGLSQVMDHRVYHQDGFFQVDIRFEKGTKDWQWESGKNFAVDKFYRRKAAQYDIHDYDLWLIDHAQERTRGLIYRCFVGGKLQMAVSYPEETFASGQSLKLTVHPSEESVWFEPEELGGAFSRSMSYSNIKAVDVTLDGGTMPLETALKNGLLTAEDIFSLARRDARAGICEEILESNRGVAGYTFRYPDYSLLWVNDLYEMPSEDAYPVSYLVVYLASNPEGTVQYHHSPDGKVIDMETGLPNDRENWGLRFSVKEVTSTGVTLYCTQEGGQQVGDLRISGSLLSDGSWSVDRIVHENEWIPMNQESEITIDWSQVCGAKESGNYYLELYIEDVYEESELHPLIEKYHDIQQYKVVFTIP